VDLAISEKNECGKTGDVVFRSDVLVRFSVNLCEDDILGLRGQFLCYSLILGGNLLAWTAPVGIDCTGRVSRRPRNALGIERDGPGRLGNVTRRLLTIDDDGLLLFKQAIQLGS
jgi:hypothetical protein